MANASNSEHRRVRRRIKSRPGYRYIDREDYDIDALIERRRREFYREWDAYLAPDDTAFFSFVPITIIK